MVDILVNYYNLLVREQVDVHMPKLAIFLEENSIRAVILGIPGVGKTTIISEVEDIFEERD